MSKKFILNIVSVLVILFIVIIFVQTVSFNQEDEIGCKEVGDLVIFSNETDSQKEFLIDLYDSIKRNTDGKKIYDYNNALNVKKSILNRITEVEIDSEDITNIDCLMYCTNLKEITITNTSIKDIEVLKNFKSLKKINLSNNKIEDVSVFEYSLKMVWELDLSGNKIKAIDSIGDLDNLKTLDISNNKIEDISILSNLQGLKNLNIGNNPLKDSDEGEGKLNSLKVLELLKDIDMSNCNIEDKDIQNLTSLKNIKVLNLNSNKLENINVIAEKFGNDPNFMTNIKQLDLGNNDIEDISFLEKAENLKLLNIENNNVKNIEPLYRLEGLEKTFIEGNHISRDQIEELDRWTDGQIITEYNTDNLDPRIMLISDASSTEKKDLINIVDIKSQKGTNYILIEKYNPPINGLRIVWTFIGDKKLTYRIQHSTDGIFFNDLESKATIEYDPESKHNKNYFDHTTAVKGGDNYYRIVVQDYYTREEDYSGVIKGYCPTKKELEENIQYNFYYAQNDSGFSQILELKNVDNIESIMNNEDKKYRYDNKILFEHSGLPELGDNYHYRFIAVYKDEKIMTESKELTTVLSEEKIVTMNNLDLTELKNLDISFNMYDLTDKYLRLFVNVYEGNKKDEDNTKNSNPIKNLQKEHFKIYESGKSLEIEEAVRVASESFTYTGTILIDYSLSMDDSDIEKIEKLNLSFINKKKMKDKYMIMKFNQTVEDSGKFLKNKNKLKYEVEKDYANCKGNGRNKTAFYDAVLKGIDRLSQEKDLMNNKKFVIVFTDGDNTFISDTLRDLMFDYFHSLTEEEKKGYFKETATESNVNYGAFESKEKFDLFIKNKYNSTYNHPDWIKNILADFIISYAKDKRIPVFIVISTVESNLDKLSKLLKTIAIETGGVLIKSKKGEVAENGLYDFLFAQIQNSYAVSAKVDNNKGKHKLKVKVDYEYDGIKSLSGESKDIIINYD